MKYCPKCKKKKKLADFNKNLSRKDGVQTCCRKCSNAKDRDHYKRNKFYYIFRNEMNRHMNRQNVYDYLKSHPCKCGETRVACLEFDHVRGDKKFNISQMLQGMFHWNQIWDEIKKCDVKCANCHKIRTAKQFNWYRTLIDVQT